MNLLLFAEAAADKDWYECGALGYMHDGGIFMWPILVLAIIALGVVIERFRSLMMLARDNRELRERWDPLESTCRHASLSIL